MSELIDSFREQWEPHDPANHPPGRAWSVIRDGEYSRDYNTVEELLVGEKMKLRLADRSTDNHPWVLLVDVADEDCCYQVLCKPV